MESGAAAFLAQVPDAAPDFQTTPRAAADLAALLYISGTTGRSKGAMLSHGDLWRNAETLVEAWAFDRNDVLIHALPIFHIHGLFVATNVAPAAAASMLLLPKFDPDRVLAASPSATTMMGVPTFYTRLLAEDRCAEIDDEPLTETPPAPRGATAGAPRAAGAYTTSRDATDIHS